MKNIKTLVKLYLLPAFIFSSAMVCTPSCSNNAYGQDDNNVIYQQKYSFKMKLNVPRIYNNEKSLGYRKYQSQVIDGVLALEYDKFGTLVNLSFANMVNKKHKLSNGRYVTYDAILDDEKPFKVVAIGDNKSKRFNTISICFSIIAEPSFNIGPIDQDTSLYVTLSGKGNIKNSKIKLAKGYVSGTLGCGCTAYGHISPTRLWWLYGVSSVVDDVAAVYGTWQIKLLK